MEKKANRAAESGLLKPYQRFVKPFFLDLTFVAASFILILATRWKLATYITEVQLQAQQLVSIQEAMQSSAPNIAMIEPIMAAIEPIIIKARLLIFLVAPLCIWIFWTLTQGANFSLIASKKVKLKYILKFGMVNLPFFVLLTVLFDMLVQTSNSILTEGKGLSVLVLLITAFFFINYLTFVASAIARGSKAIEIPARTLRIATFHIHKLILYFLPLSAGALSIPFIVIAIYSSFVAGVYIPIAYLTAAMTVVIFFLGWLRAFLITKIEKV